jgi:hypothetical protein
MENSIFANLFKCTTEDKSKKSNDNQFFVLNSDRTNGLYVKKLKDLLDLYDFVPRYEDDNFSQLNNLDGIIFRVGCDYDYEFVTDRDILRMASDKMYKDWTAYDICKDFEKIKFALKNLRDVTPKKQKTEPTCQRANIALDYDKFLASLIATLNVKIKPVTPKKETEDTGRKKITIHDNWVKIGFDQYDVYVDMWGNQFIEHPTAGRLYIKKDRYGRKVLMTA